MQTLTVVNQMLGTIGEAPLASLEDAHEFRGACISTLESESTRIQASGWWFNMETVTLTPQLLTGRLSVPNDALAVRTPTRETVQRGRYLYDLSEGTFVFQYPLNDVTLIRHVVFEDLPETAAAYIAACALVKFQSRYDSDTAKTRELKIAEQETLVAIKTDHIRNRRSNFIQSNAKLMRLKVLTNGARRYIR
jgi:hypothetical protein